MDNDNFRRGKLTDHKKFLSTAILAGNSLLTIAFEILTDSFKLKNKVKIKFN